MLSNNTLWRLTFKIQLEDSYSFLFFFLAIPEKNKLEGWEHIFLKKTPGIFKTVTLPLEISQNCVTPVGISKAKQRLRPMEIPHDFILITPGNSSAILLTPAISTFYLFNTPFFKFGFTPCKAEQPLRGMQLEEKKHKKDYRKQKICFKRTCS